MENGYAGRSYRKGFEFMTDDIVDTLAREAVDKTSILFKAVKPKGGEMPVVMGAGGSGILLHEAIGHALRLTLTVSVLPSSATCLARRCATSISMWWMMVPLPSTAEP